MGARNAIVMGAGLAGIAAAVKLAQSGVRIMLLETSRRLGGRASSHDDPTTGQTVDNCQHVLMGCCTNLLDLYGRLGVAEHVRWHPDLFFADKQGHVDVMRASSLPAPLHLAGAMLRFKTLSTRDKLAISRAMLAMMRMSPPERARLTDVTFGDWLRGPGHRQTQAAIDRFWSVVIVSALNQTVGRAAAAYAIQVFQDGFLAHPRAFVMGTSAVPLRELYDPAAEVVEAAGGQVRFGTSVERVRIEQGRVTGIELDSGEVLTADAYISALPFDRLAKVLPPGMATTDARFAGLDRFRHSPIIGIHLWFDRRVLDLPHLIFVDSPLQWVFDKTPAPAPAPGSTGQYLHGVISAAHEWVDKPADEIVQMAVRELRQYLPAMHDANLIRGKALKEKRATFSPEPGIEPHRPRTEGAIENLLLAGDWTATGWPATMEGAVRSGYRAAAAAALARPGEALVHDLPASDLYRFVAATGRWRSSTPAAAADINR